MIPELGHFALIVALFIGIALAVLPIAGAARDDAAWMGFARPAAQAQFVFDTASSTLYFDSDGNGSAPGVTVAQMVGLTSMSAADFWIV